LCVIVCFQPSGCNSLNKLIIIIIIIIIYYLLSYTKYM